MVVGALIFVLGIDLVKEALWDTRHRVSWLVHHRLFGASVLTGGFRMEYITIASIMICMTVWDFVIGVIFGIVVSCKCMLSAPQRDVATLILLALGVFFVVQSSQRRSIRTLHTGETVMSTVRRPGAHRAYIREVSRQTTIVKLQGKRKLRTDAPLIIPNAILAAGFLFFGTITHVEETIRTLVEGAAWQRNPVRFLILDLSPVAGVDMSAAEAFVRVQRVLAARRVVLVFCGFSLESNIGRSLRNVDLLEMDGVELFATFNDALECESCSSVVN